MRVFANEIRKIFDWKILISIAVIGMIFWFGILRDFPNSYDSLTRHGIYGAYQTEMFRQYGETLEPEELADFDFAGKYAEVYAAGDEIIANNPVFAEYGIGSFEEYIAWRESEAYWIIVDGNIFDSEQDEDISLMNEVLNGNEPKTLDEWYDSPLVRNQSLRTLEDRYVNYGRQLENYINYDNRPIVVQAAEKIREIDNNSLVNDYLMPEFSLYSSTVCVFCIIAVIFLITPLITTDRSRNLNLLQYSSKIGRKTLKIQFIAAISASVGFTLCIIAAAFTPFLVLAGEYWNARIMSMGNISMWLYDITFGQYVFILAGMIAAICVTAACAAFGIARFSNNIINALIKAVPLGLALLVICLLCVNYALSSSNIMANQVFRGRFIMPEVIVPCIFAIICLLIETIITIREKRVDVL